MNKVILTYRTPNGNIDEEAIWVKPVGEYYQVDNIPFFAPNIAIDDIISVEEEDGFLHFEELISRSGHSTVQIVMLDVIEKDRIIKQIEIFMCPWEGFGQIIAIDIPPLFEYKKIKHFLQNELETQVLDYKEACLSDTHRSEVYEN